MQKLLLFFLILLSASCTNAQITRNNWMVGGNGHISFQRETNSNFLVKGTEIVISPDVGYFIIDKLAAGARLTYYNNRIRYNSIDSKTRTIAGGPFVRYYFLNPDNRINFLSETALQFSHYFTDRASLGDDGSIELSAGPVIYFNSSVGIELLANYKIFFNSPSEPVQNIRRFTVGIGLQIHLEKE